MNSCLLAVTLALLTAAHSLAQAPRISVLFPNGGKIGSTVEVELRGSALAGAERLLVNSPAITGQVDQGAAKPDQAARPLFQAKCGSCHELRSPANRSLTPAQWAATVERMVKVRQAPLSADEADRISRYLQGEAKAGRVTGRLTVGADAKPGIYEVRALTARGISTAGLFEVGTLPEIVGVNSRMEDAQRAPLPCVANGSLSGNAERHYFRFAAKRGQRLVFDLKAFRFDERTQVFFNPQLRLLKLQGKEVAENHGYYDLDPLVDWTCGADGEYILEVRDMLGRGNPGSVYRMTMGALPFDTMVFPPAVPVGKASQVRLIGKNVSATVEIPVPPPARPGLCTVPTGMGAEPVVATPFAISRDDASATAPVTLPAGFAGRVAKAGDTDTFDLRGKGAYELEIYAQRLGSSSEIRAQVLAPNGRPVATLDGDSRTTVTLEEGKPYKLKVEERGNYDEGDRVYYVEARPLAATLRVQVRPDEVTLRPGSSVAVDVVVTRRDRIEGPISVKLSDLPPGVSASPVFIAPDQTVGRVILTASPEAKGVAQPIRVIVESRAGTETVTAAGEPQEVYLYNNQPNYIDRSECVVAVCGEAELSPALLGEPMVHVHPRKSVSVRVKLNRKAGYRSALTARMVGLPPGWVAAQEAVPAGRDEVTLTVRPDGQNPVPFLRRDGSLGPWKALVEVVADELPFVVAEVTVAADDK